jgi:hypothetical protein
MNQLPMGILCTLDFYGSVCGYCTIILLHAVPKQKHSDGMPYSYSEHRLSWVKLLEDL